MVAKYLCGRWESGDPEEVRSLGDLKQALWMPKHCFGAASPPDSYALVCHLVCARLCRLKPLHRCAEARARICARPLCARQCRCSACRLPQTTQRHVAALVVPRHSARGHRAEARLAQTPRRSVVAKWALFICHQLSGFESSAFRSRADGF